MVGSEVDCVISEADEQHHQQRRLGEEADQHLAARAERAERGADVHRGQRDEHAGQREQAHERDGVGGAREAAGRSPATGRSRRRAPCMPEDDVGRHAEDRRGMSATTASLWNSLRSIR